MKHPFHSFHARRGQSLLESIIALSALTAGLLGIMGLLAQSFSLSRTTGDQLRASYLATEGVELARNIIYHDVYAGPGNNWGTCLSTGDYDLDFQTLAAAPFVCGPIPNYNFNNPTPLYFDPVTGIYGHLNSLPSGNNPMATKFYRDVHVVVSGQHITVSVTVYWSGGNSFTTEDHFYNWHP